MRAFLLVYSYGSISEAPSTEEGVQSTEEGFIHGRRGSIHGRRGSIHERRSSIHGKTNCIHERKILSLKIQLKSHQIHPKINHSASEIKYPMHLGFFHKKSAQKPQYSLCIRKQIIQNNSQPENHLNHINFTILRFPLLIHYLCFIPKFNFS